MDSVFHAVVRGKLASTNIQALQNAHCFKMSHHFSSNIFNFRSSHVFDISERATVKCSSQQEETPQENAGGRVIIISSS